MFAFKLRFIIPFILAISGSALAQLRISNPVIDGGQLITVSAEIDTRGNRADLYLAVPLNGIFYFYNNKGEFVDHAEALYSNQQYKGTINVIENLPSIGITPGSYTLFQVLTHPGTDPFIATNWIGELHTLELKINQKIGEPSGGVINRQDRNAVAQAFRNRYLKPIPNMGFTGNISNCNAGSTSIEYQQSVIDRINFYRSMVGLNEVTLAPNLLNHNKAAMMMVANSSLSHDPPLNWRCYSSEGADGAGNSNLALGTEGPDAIDLYMADPGNGNEAVGHRRWILNPPAASFGTGDVPGANSLAVWVDFSNLIPEGLEYISWPSSGFFPTSLMPYSNRWSFSIIDRWMDLSKAQVKMVNLHDGSEIPVAIEPYYEGYGLNTLVWVPLFRKWSSATEEVQYQITVFNVLDRASKSKSYTYIVKTINL